MVSLLLSGIALITAAVASVWYLAPRNGQVHPLAVVPFLETLIPVTIIVGLTFGVALLLLGILGT